MLTAVRRCKTLHYIYAYVTFIVAVIILFVISATSVFAATSATMEASVVVVPSLTIDIPTSTIAVNLNPTTNNFDERDLVIKVGTNNPTGFKLYATTPDNNTNLVNVADNTKIIPNLTSSVAASAFPANNWGYRITQDSATSSGNYGAFTPSSATPILQSTGPVNEKMAALGFGTKIDYTKPSGLYQLKLNFKALPTVTTEYMQTLDPALCTTDPTVVIDQRDEQTYLIQRLPDGKCWMLDNLNLDLTRAEIVNTLTPTNTNASADSLKSLREGNRAAGAQYATAGLTLSNWGNTDYSYSQPQVNISGDCSTSGTYPCSYDGPYTHNTVAPNSNGVGTGSHKIGVYYNYCAATAGSYCYGSGTSDYGTPSSGATQDICPANWRIPTGGASGEYQALCNAVGGGSCNTTMVETSPTSMQYQLSVTYSGNYGGSGISGAVTRQGVSGFYWTSTQATTADRVGGLHVYHATESVSPAATLARWGANSIRCILKD